MDRDRKVLVYVDVEAARAALEAGGTAVAAFGEKLLAFARGHGRVLEAVAYGDLGEEEARELRRGGFEPRLTTEDGEGSAPESIAIVLDATEALHGGPPVQTVVLVTDDAALGELCRRLRRHGRYAIAIAPAALAGREPGRSADRAVSLEELLAGSAAIAAPVAAAPAPERPRERRPPATQTLDLESYDWTRLVLLLRDLEGKMPFVGMRWLKNKVIGPHNTGAVTLADKQLLLNRAVELGLVETYRVNNRDEQGDPVTACRLVRTEARVRDILDRHPAPLQAPAAAPDAGSSE